MLYANEMAHQCDVPPDGECYLTEGWVVAHWLRMTNYRPPPDVLIWDPAACGVNGWAIGRALGLAWERPYLLSDIRPMGPGVGVARFPPESGRPEHDGPIMLATNCPYSEISLWIKWFRINMKPGDTLLLVCETIHLTTKEPRSYGLVEKVQPRKRFAFGLVEGDAEFLRTQAAAGKRCAKPKDSEHTTGPTAVGLTSSGKGHCVGLWALPIGWAAGHQEICEEVAPIDLHMGKELMKLCADSVQ